MFLFKSQPDFSPLSYLVNLLHNLLEHLLAWHKYINIYCAESTASKGHFRLLLRVLTIKIPKITQIIELHDKTLFFNTIKK